jgi:hypothetical protein
MTGAGAFRTFRARGDRNRGIKYIQEQRVDRNSGIQYIQGQG